MTKEEAIKILTRIMNNNFYGGEVQMACKLGIEALSQPSLPSDLDEAAEKYTNDSLNNLGAILRVNVSNAFKAGAEWMAGQFQKIDGYLADWCLTSDGKEYCCGIKTKYALEVPEGFYIRKK